MAAIVSLLWGTWLAVKGLRPVGRGGSCVPRRQGPPHAPISVLKPVKGLDADLAENLESFFHLEYSRFELLFSLATADDPARPVIERLISKYPRVRARLFIGESRLGANPKINNLARSYEEARYDWILISDSNIRATPDYLASLAREFTADIGVLTAVVKGERGKTLGGKLEAAFLNSFYARWMFLALALDRPCVIGKSMMFRRSQAARFGGIRTLALYLAEDYMAGEAMRMLGLRIAIFSAPVVQPLTAYRLRDFWSRHLRWSRIRKAQAPVAYCAEPWVSALLPGLCGAWAMAAITGENFMTMFAGHLSLWCLVDMLLLHRLGGKVSIETVLAWLARETLAFPLWLHGASGSTVHWRGKRLRILKGGLLAESSAS